MRRNGGDRGVLGQETFLRCMQLAQSVLLPLPDEKIQ